MEYAFLSALPLSTRVISVSAFSKHGRHQSLALFRPLKTHPVRPFPWFQNRQQITNTAKQSSSKGRSNTLRTTFRNLTKRANKLLLAVMVAFAITLTPSAALAARGGGRMGGSSFSAPASRSAPSRQRSSSSRHSYPRHRSGMRPEPFLPRFLVPSLFGSQRSLRYGHGHGAPVISVEPLLNPFTSPGFGFAALAFFIVMGTIAPLLSGLGQPRTRTAGVDLHDPDTVIAVIKVGLLSSARSLQLDLDKLARSGDTSSTSGLTFLLQETATTLLRHKHYWTYGNVATRRDQLSKAEGEFNRLALDERLKLDEETLTSVSGRRIEKSRASATDVDLSNAPCEYIVVSIVVAAVGSIVRRLQNEAVRDVHHALKAFASVSAEGLQAVEVIWAPQSLSDTLTEQEMLADHPELKRL